MNNNTGRLPSFPESVMLTGPVKSNTKPNTLNHVPPINPIRSDHVGKPQEGSMMLPSLNEVMKPIFTDNVNMYKQMPSISSFQKQNPSGTHSPTSSPTLPPPNRSGPPSLPGGMPSGMSMGNLPLPSLMNSLPKHQSPMNPHQNTNSPPMGSHQSHQHQGNPPSMNSQHHSHQNNGPQMSPHQSHQHQGNSMGTHQHQNNSSMNSHQHQGNAPMGSQHSHQQNNQSMGNMGHPNNNPSSPMSGHPHNSHNPLLALTHPHTNPMALQNKSNNSNGNNNNNNNNINNTNIPINSQPKKQNLYIMNDRNQIEFDRSGVAAPPPLSYGPPGMPMSTQLPYPNNMPMMPNKPNPSNPNYQEQLQEAKRISDNMKANVRGYLDSNATTKKRKTGSDAPETPQPTILSDSRTSAFSPMKKRETHPTVSNNASSEDLSPQEPDRGKLADEQTNFAHLLQNNFSGVNLSNDSCGELLEIYRNFHKNENAKLIPPVPARADLKVENK